MIIDKIEQIDKYASLHPYFKEAFNFLKNAFDKPEGKYILDGDNLYVNISEVNLRDIERVEMEAHRKYIDIQMVIEGEESYGCSSLTSCRTISSDYCESSDIIFYKDRPSMVYKACKGLVSIYFPTDAHAPLIGNGKVKKAVVKVKIDPDMESLKLNTDSKLEFFRKGL